MTVLTVDDVQLDADLDVFFGNTCILCNSVRLDSFMSIHEIIKCRCYALYLLDQ